MRKTGKLYGYLKASAVLVVIIPAVLTGCRSTSTDTVHTPDPPAGMETIDVPGAEEVSSTPSSELPPGEPEATDKLKPGDYIAIQVYDQPALSLELGIPASGVVNYPVIGKVQLEGRKIAEVEEDIRTRLEEKMLNSAQVTLVVKYYNRRSVYVLGNVTEAGSFGIPFGKNLTLLQAISMAKGFSDNADKDNLLLMREGENGRKAYRIAYSEIVKKGALEKDIPLKDGDIIIVQERAKVYVLGKVNMPGGFVVSSDQKMTLTKAISLAKGFDPLAAQSKTTVIRTLSDGTTRIFRINVGEIFNGTLSDPVILPGYIIFVPESFF